MFWPPKRRFVVIAAIGAALVTMLLAVAPPVSRSALASSLILAAGATAIALPVGTLLAILIARCELPGTAAAAAAVGCLLFIPLYVQLSGWDAALGKLGWFVLLRGALDQPLLAGMRGAIFVHGVAAIPWVTMFVALGLISVDRHQEEAASLVLPPLGVLWRVTLPQTWPFIAAAAMWTAISTAAEMTVTNIYLINPREWTYTERFYMTLAVWSESTSRRDLIVGIAALAIIGALALATISRWPAISRSYALQPLRWRPRPLILWTSILWLLIAVLIGVPLVSLIVKAGFIVIREDGVRHASWSLAKCLAEVAAAPDRFQQEFIGTLIVGFLAATLATTIAALLAWPARRGDRRALPAVVVTALALVLPGPVIGSGLIALLNHDLPPALSMGDGTVKSWLLILYDDTPFAPILAQTIRALPIATLLLWHSFATLNPNVLAAAALDGLSPGRVLLRIALPQRWRTAAAAWIAAIAVCTGDLAWSHLVTPPGLDLISRRVFGLVHSGVEEQVAAICLITIGAYAILATFALGMLRNGLRASHGSLREPQLPLR